MYAVELVPFVVGARQYFYIYWALTGVTMVLEFAVMYELLVNALKPYSALIDFGKMLFRWAAIFLILAALSPLWPRLVLGTISWLPQSICCSAAFASCSAGFCCSSSDLKGGLGSPGGRTA